MKNKRVLRWGIIAIVASVFIVIVGYLYGEYARGVKAFERGDYQTAVTLLQGSPFDNELYSEACLKLGSQYIEEDNYVDAMEVMEGLGSDVYQEALQKICRRCFQKENYTELFSYADHLEKEIRQELLAQFAETAMDQGKYADAKVLYEKAGNTLTPQYNLCMAINAIQGLNIGKISENEFQQIKNYLIKSSDIQGVQKYLAIVEAILGEDYLEAYEQIKDIPDTIKGGGNTVFWERILYSYISEKKLTSVERYLNGAFVLNKMLGKTDFDEKVYKTSLKSSDTAIGCLPEGKKEIVVPSLDQIYNTYGSDPNGKILIVKQCYSYGAKNATTVVAFDLMEDLPTQYFPKTIDEISYVIVISYNYRDDPTGYYSGETRALQEMATVKVYSLKKQKDIYKSGTVYGPHPPSFFTYYNTPPRFKSGGRPDASRQLIEALEKIIK